MSRPSPLVSIVVIGKNSGKTLRECFQSIEELENLVERPELFYVDSGSTDSSLTIAKEAGATVLNVEDEEPNAAKGRNLGWKAATGEFVLFLDGDTCVVADFVSTALPYFQEKDVAVVCGKRKEQFPDSNYYHRALNIEWELPSAPIPYCGGDAFIRRTALADVEGYSPELHVGEEPELRHKLYQKGWKVKQLKIPMTLHNLNITRFSQYWNRSMRTGYGYAAVSQKTGQAPIPLWKRESQHNLIKGSLILASLIVAPFTLLPLTILGLLVIRTALLTFTTQDWRTSLAYGIHAHFQHIPLFFGQLHYWWKSLFKIV